MRVKTSFLALAFFFMIPAILYAQQHTETTYFDDQIKKMSDPYKDEFAFAKAQSFFLQKEWDSTLVYTTQQLSTPSNTKELEDFCHFFRGYSFKQKKIFKEAKEEFSVISKDFSFYKHTQLNLGTIALEQNEYKKALDYFKKIENYSPSELQGIEKNNIEENIGLCYMYLGEFDQAETYLKKTIQFQEQKKDTISLIGTYGNIANLYYEQYKDELAIPFFQKAYDLSKKVKDVELKTTTALNMAVVEENRKKYPLSLTYRKEYEQWKDSLNDQNKIYEVAQLEKQFAVKQKQKEVSLLQAENEIKVAERNGLLYSSIVLLILLGTGIYFYKEKIKSNKIIVAQKETLDELNATKDKLFSIVSHDLRSSVHALKTSHTTLIDTVAAKDLKKIDTVLHTNSAIVNGAYNLLDNLLNWALLQTKQSYFEIAEMRLYFIVEQVAHNYQALMLEKQIYFENKVSKSDKVFADQESIKIILRNLIDNAIKFSNTDGKIKIYTQHKDLSYCDLIVEDTGMGMKDSTRVELLKDSVLLSKKENEDIIGTGLGMQLCKSMIKKNHGKFSIESELGKGTKMIVSLSKTSPNGYN